MTRAGLLGAVLAALAAAIPPAAAQPVPGALYVATDGPVTFTTLVNNRSAFPNAYFANLMFRGSATPTNNLGVHAFTLFSDGNLAGDSNSLAGVPLSDGNYSAFVPRDLAIVVNLNIRTPAGPAAWASISTADPTNLTAAWASSPDYSPNQPVATVRQLPGNIVEIGFAYARDTLRDFLDHPVIVRLSNVCRG